VRENDKATDDRVLTNVKPSYNPDNNLMKHSNDSVDYLQRTTDDHALKRLVHPHAMAFDFATIGIQLKLKVSRPGDTYEQEADRVAE
jgi:hypothetical protein